jgi:hypothetical protein
LLRLSYAVQGSCILSPPCYQSGSQPRPSIRLATTSATRATADDLAELVGDGDEFGQVWLTPPEENDGGAIVGLTVGETKLSLDMPAELLIGLAARCLRAAREAGGARMYSAAGDLDLEAIRALVLTAEDRAELRRQAVAELALKLEADSLAAVEQGRQQGAAEWAAAVDDLATACTLRGVERQLELQRLAPIVARARGK